MQVANESQIAMSHRWHCDPSDLSRVDAHPPAHTDESAHRYLCRSCGLYLTGTQLQEIENR
ncbi:hypothetical protein GIY23_01905 [Allosaccharopolyspora coralli]|uniref:Uncharacterized protein n=1 Tax=Allosaccharopolyspora coralli TaxID=2665642 RepID=A0A5Q3Q2A3_9PSEU|nr:hypothetical protein [Allosaccharopolyspora coralli]QGK68473.1 hypothetical protein GIY23_01905 [Allosaccharopolyspora coralli]